MNSTLAEMPTLGNKRKFGGGLILDTFIFLDSHPSFGHPYKSQLTLFCNKGF